MSSQIHEILGLSPKYKQKQRIGRGEGSKGKTSGRGQKGAGSRGGKNMRLGFEGGQTEAYRRFPQRGFSNFNFETKYHAVNVSMLERFEDGATVDRASLKVAGLIPNTRLGFKILGHGALTKKLTIHADAYSRNAHKLVSDIGGSPLDTKGQAYTFAKPKNKRLGRKLDKRLTSLGIANESPTKDDDAGSDNAVAPEATPKASRKASKPKVKPPAGDDATSGNDGLVTEAPESGAE